MNNIFLKIDAIISELVDLKNTLQEDRPADLPLLSFFEDEQESKKSNIHQFGDSIASFYFQKSEGNKADKSTVQQFVDDNAELLRKAIHFSRSGTHESSAPLRRAPAQYAIFEALRDGADENIVKTACQCCNSGKSKGSVYFPALCLRDYIENIISIGKSQESKKRGSKKKDFNTMLRVYDRTAETLSEIIRNTQEDRNNV